MIREYRNVELIKLVRGDEDALAELEDGLMAHLELLHRDAAVALEDGQPRPADELGIGFDGCDVCATRATLAYVLPRVLMLARDGLVELVEPEAGVARRPSAVRARGAPMTAGYEQLELGPIARDDDPDTSHESAARLTSRTRVMRKLLAVYVAAELPLTDELAAARAGVEGGWKRCSDLRNAGLIERVEGDGLSSAGRRVMRCQATYAGRLELLGGAA